GRVYYETSPDGVTWTTRWNIAHSFADLDNLHGMIGVQSWGSPGSNPIPGIFASVGVIESTPESNGPVCRVAGGAGDGSARSICGWHLPTGEALPPAALSRRGLRTLARLALPVPSRPDGARGVPA